jgi:hypothetical protein
MSPEECALWCEDLALALPPNQQRLREIAAHLRRIPSLEKEVDVLNNEIGAWVQTCPYDCYHQESFKKVMEHNG